VTNLPISHAAKCLEPPGGCGEYARSLPDRTAVIFHAPGCPAKAADDRERDALGPLGLRQPYDPNGHEVAEMGWEHECG